MKKSNSVFIATSIDGYISDKQGGIEWLNSIPNPEKDDMGYLNFISEMDALIMGRVTFETVLGFDIDWPYDKPVFVLSNSLNEIPQNLKEKVFLISGELAEVVRVINEKGYQRLYIDGGTTIQNFLKEDLIDEMTITTIPILLGGGSPLFKNLDIPLTFRLVDTKNYLGEITQNRFKRKK